MAGENEKSASVPLSEPASEKSRPRRTWWIWAVPAGALAILLGFALNAEIKYRRRAGAIRALQEIGNVQFHGAPPASWLSRLVGRKTTSDPPVFSVSLKGPSAGDAALAHLRWIPELEGLNLHDGVVTAAGLRHLRTLTHLRQFSLFRTQIPDAGLVHIGKLTELWVIHLSGNGVTDTGLAHLRGLTGLKNLTLFGTRVSDASLVHLRGLTRLQYIDLRRLNVTDTGLAHLRGLTRLHTLYLSGTDVTDAGLVHIGGLRRLTTLMLRNTRVTDAGLTQIHRLVGLKHIDLGGTDVTDAGMAELRKHVPGVYISGQPRARESAR